MSAAPEQSHGHEPRANAIDDAIRRLARAIARARHAILWERVWPPLAAAGTVIGLFIALSWAGLWMSLTPIWRIAGLAAFAILLGASLVPALFVRLPRRSDALGRLDRTSGLGHRPATAIDDRLADGADDPVVSALWQAHRERAAAAAVQLRAGIARPGVAARDPYAVRALVLLAIAATFFVAEGERGKRILAAFDFSGVVAPKLYRVDAWITPPVYTGRPPLLLPGIRHDEPSPGDIAAVSIPSGSIFVVRATGLETLALTARGGLSEHADAAPTASEGLERQFKITGDGTIKLSGLPSGATSWSFQAIPDRAPSIVHLKDPMIVGRAGLSLNYRVEDDYGVKEAQAMFVEPQVRRRDGDPAPRVLVPAPDFALLLPSARTRAGAGQTTREMAEHPWAGAVANVVLVARDEAGNEGRSEPQEVQIPERGFTKPLAHALIEQRRTLALDANTRERVQGALEALLIAPERFTPEPSIYLGVRTAATRLKLARNDDDLRGVVDYLWEIAVLIEDGTMSDAERDLRAAEEALRQAIDRGAHEQEIRKLTEALRQAMDRFLRALAEQMRRDGSTDARPLDRNTRIVRPQDLKNMLDRIESLARSGARDAARRLLDELQAMLDGLQRNRQARGEPGDAEAGKMLDDLGRMIQEQQRLRDRTYRQGRENRADRRNRSGEPGQNRERRDYGELRKNQEGLRQQLERLLEDMRRQRQRGGDDSVGDAEGTEKEAGEALGRAEQAMRDAEGALGEGEADSAVDSQGRALQNLRRGAQSLADMMQGQGDGPGDPNGPSPQAAERTDPLGRPVRSREYGDDYSVKVPDEIDVQRARRVLEELRRRLGEPSRPQLELEYLERLLRDF